MMNYAQWMKRGTKYYQEEDDYSGQEWDLNDFWTWLFRLADIRLKFSFAYHPHSDNETTCQLVLGDLFEISCELNGWVWQNSGMIPNYQLR